ncbi:MAG: hypothetical protein DRJ38_01355 [Thermoprotei archaeon]|nr:MAG: hypothetical protein DRJ38_01355 [Thermoprotei archaeon]
MEKDRRVSESGREFSRLVCELCLVEEDLGDARGEHDVGKWVRRALDKLRLEIDFNSEELAALY